MTNLGNPGNFATRRRSCSSSPAPRTTRTATARLGRCLSEFEHHRCRGRSVIRKQKHPIRQLTPAPYLRTMVHLAHEASTKTTSCSRGRSIIRKHPHPRIRQLTPAPVSRRPVRLIRDADVPIQVVTDDEEEEDTEQRNSDTTGSSTTTTSLRVSFLNLSHAFHSYDASSEASTATTASATTSSYHNPE